MFEKDFVENYEYIVGCDEVGRGPLAGPVIAGAVLIRAKDIHVIDKLLDLGVTDSKKLTDKKRKAILEKLAIDISKKEWSINFEGIEIQIAISKLSAKEIDRYNILQSSLKAMKKASYKLVDSSKCLYLVDGNKSFDKSKDNVIPVVKGDSKSAVIGLASIVAKVIRDELMISFAKKYPRYDFEKNAGYPTAKHREAIATYGITPIHRKTFKGVKEYVQTTSS